MRDGEDVVFHYEHDSSYSRGIYEESMLVLYERIIILGTPSRFAACRACMRSPKIPNESLHSHSSWSCTFENSANIMSALDEIRKRAAIDIDQMDPVVAEKLGPFHDMSESDIFLSPADVKRAIRPSSLLWSLKHQIPSSSIKLSNKRKQKVRRMKKRLT